MHSQVDTQRPEISGVLVPLTPEIVDFKVGLFRSRSGLGRALQSVGTYALPGDTTAIRHPVRSGVYQALTPGGNSRLGRRIGGVPRINRCPNGTQFGGRFANRNFNNCGPLVFEIPGGDAIDRAAGAAVRAARAASDGPAAPQGTVRDIANTLPQGRAIQIIRSAQIPAVGAIDKGRLESSVSSAINTVVSDTKIPSLLVRRDGVTLKPTISTEKLGALKNNIDMDKGIFVTRLNEPSSMGEKEIPALLNTNLNGVSFGFPGGARLDVRKTRELTASDSRRLTGAFRRAHGGQEALNYDSGILAVADASNGAITYTGRFPGVKRPYERITVENADGSKRIVPRWVFEIFLSASAPQRGDRASWTLVENIVQEANRKSLEFGYSTNASSKQALIEFKTASFMAESEFATLAFQVKRVAADWDPDLPPSGGYRCPPGTRYGGRITDRFGRNCGWNVSRRLANRLERVGRNLGEGLDERRDRRVGRRVSRAEGRVDRAQNRLNRAQERLGNLRGVDSLVEGRRGRTAGRNRGDRARARMERREGQAQRLNAFAQRIRAGGGDRAERRRQRRGAQAERLNAFAQRVRAGGGDREQRRLDRAEGRRQRRGAQAERLNAFAQRVRNGGGDRTARRNDRAEARRQRRGEQAERLNAFAERVRGGGGDRAGRREERRQRRIERRRAQAERLNAFAQRVRDGGGRSDRDSARVDTADTRVPQNGRPRPNILPGGGQGMVGPRTIEDDEGGRPRLPVPERRPTPARPRVPRRTEDDANVPASGGRPSRRPRPGRRVMTGRDSFMEDNGWDANEDIRDLSDAEIQKRIDALTARRRGRNQPVDAAERNRRAYLARLRREKRRREQAGQQNDQNAVEMPDEVVPEAGQVPSETNPYKDRFNEAMANLTPAQRRRVEQQLDPSYQYAAQQLNRVVDDPSEENIMSAGANIAGRLEIAEEAVNAPDGNPEVMAIRLGVAARYWDELQNVEAYRRERDKQNAAQNLKELDAPSEARIKNLRRDWDREHNDVKNIAQTFDEEMRYANSLHNEIKELQNAGPSSNERSESERLARLDAVRDYLDNYNRELVRKRGVARVNLWNSKQRVLDGLTPSKRNEVNKRVNAKIEEYRVRINNATSEADLIRIKEDIEGDNIGVGELGLPAVRRADEMAFQDHIYLERMALVRERRDQFNATGGVVNDNVRVGGNLPDGIRTRAAQNLTSEEFDALEAHAANWKEIYGVQLDRIKANPTIKNIQQARSQLQNLVDGIGAPENGNDLENLKDLVVRNLMDVHLRDLNQQMSDAKMRQAKKANEFLLQVPEADRGDVNAEIAAFRYANELALDIRDNDRDGLVQIRDGWLEMAAQSEEFGVRQNDPFANVNDPRLNALHHAKIEDQLFAAAQAQRQIDQIDFVNAEIAAREAQDKAAGVVSPFSGDAEKLLADRINETKNKRRDILAKYWKTRYNNERPWSNPNVNLPKEKLAELNDAAQTGDAQAQAKLLEWAKNVYEHSEFEGGNGLKFRTVVTGVQPLWNGSFSVTGKVQAYDHASGRWKTVSDQNNWTRTINARQGNIYHNYLRLNDIELTNADGELVKVRNGGFATIFNQHAWTWAKNSGFETLEVSAALEDGPYVWGRVGYRAKSSGQVQTMANAFSRELNDYRDGRGSIIKNDADAAIVSMLVNKARDAGHDPATSPGHMEFILALSNDGDTKEARKIREEEIRRFIKTEAPISSAVLNLNEGDLIASSPYAQAPPKRTYPIRNLAERDPALPLLGKIDDNGIVQIVKVDDGANGIDSARVAADFIRRGGSLAEVPDIYLQDALDAQAQQFMRHDIASLWRGIQAGDSLEQMMGRPITEPYVKVKGNSVTSPSLYYRVVDGKLTGEGYIIKPKDASPRFANGNAMELLQLQLGQDMGFAHVAGRQDGEGKVLLELGGNSVDGTLRQGSYDASGMPVAGRIAHGLFNGLMGNGDRHAGNGMAYVDANGVTQPYPVDFGRGFYFKFNESKLADYVAWGGEEDWYAMEGTKIIQTIARMTPAEKDIARAEITQTIQDNLVKAQAALGNFDRYANDVDNALDTENHEGWNVNGWRSVIEHNLGVMRNPSFTNALLRKLGL